MRELHAARLGAIVGRAWAGAFYYADDLALVARSEAEMQAMLRVLDRYAREWNFQPGFAKTRVLRFGAARRRRRALYLPSMYHGDAPPTARHFDGGEGSNTNPVEGAAKYKYLGVTISESGTFTAHVEGGVEAALNQAVAEIWRVTEATGGLVAGAATAVARAVAESRVAYCAGVWAPVRGSGNSAGNWGVTTVAAAKVSATYNKLARVGGYWRGAGTHATCRGLPGAGVTGTGRRMGARNIALVAQGGGDATGATAQGGVGTRKGGRRELVRGESEGGARGAVGTAAYYSPPPCCH